MRTLFVIIGLLAGLSAEAVEKKKCWCHGMVPVYGSVLNCQEYRCPCEGANGRCGGSASTSRESLQPSKDIQRPSDKALSE